MQVLIVVAVVTVVAAVPEESAPRTLLTDTQPSADGGRSCATVTRTGTAYSRRGELRVTLQRHSYDGRRWPRFAVQELDPTAARSDAVYLDDTAGRCVRASARFDPDDGPPATVTTGKLAC